MSDELINSYHYQLMLIAGDHLFQCLDKTNRYDVSTFKRLVKLIGFHPSRDSIIEFIEKGQELHYYFILHVDREIMYFPFKKDPSVPAFELKDNQPRPVSTPSKKMAPVDAYLEKMISSKAEKLHDEVQADIDEKFKQRQALLRDKNGQFKSPFIDE